MIDKNPNKILVYGMPRTGTTILQQQIAQTYNLYNFSEAYTLNAIETHGDIYVWTRDQSDCVVKLLTTNIISGIDIFKLIEVSNFDTIVVTVGRNSVDSCVSSYYAERVANRYHYYIHETVETQEFTMDLDFVTGVWYPEYQVFVKTLQQFIDNNIKYVTVDYNNYTQNISQEINGINFSIAECDTHLINSRINYHALCRNYTDVENLINNLTNSLC
jgi:hypothetical protein